MKTPRSLLGRFALFAVLGLIDLALTYYLLRTAPGKVYESNPVAQWWLVRWGWAGLAGFKLAVVLLVLAAVQFIALYRPRTAGHVLWFACGATALVVGYSCTLLGTARAHWRPFTWEDEVRIRSEAAQIDARVQQVQAFYRLRDQLAEDLNAGRYSLEALVSRLAATPEARDPDWLKSLRHAHPAHSNRESMAEFIRYHAHLLAEWDCQRTSAEPGAKLPGRPPTSVTGGRRIVAE
jgi:hypothetical protein